MLHLGNKIFGLPIRKFATCDLFRRLFDGQFETFGRDNRPFHVVALNQLR